MARLVVAILAILAITLLPAMAVAQTTVPATVPASSEMDVMTFIATLDNLSNDTRAAGTPDEGARVRQALPPTWTVRAGSERFTVSSRAIADALAEETAARTSWADARAGAVARIEGMRDEASHLTRQGTAPPAHLRGALAEVLAAPEFRGRQRYAGLMGLVDRFRRWVRSWWPSLGPGSGVMPVVRWFTSMVRWFTWAAALAAFVLLAVLTWRLLRRATRETAVRARPPRGLEPIDARAWAARARTAAAAGDAREAVRCAYHAVLHRLDEDGVWTIAEARTPREYVRLLPAADRRQPAVSFVARLFEGTWYGGAEPGLDDAHAAVLRLGELGCDAQADPAT